MSKPIFENSEAQIMADQETQHVFVQKETQHVRYLRTDAKQWCLPLNCRSAKGELTKQEIAEAD